MSVIRDSIVLRRIGELDTRVCLLFNRGVHLPRVGALFALVSRLGDGVFWYALIAVAAVADGRAGLFAALHMVAVGLVALALYRALKSTFVRRRPFAVVQRIHAGTAPLDLYSFPSGHTLHAVAFTLVASAHYPVLAWVLAPFTLLVALSRVILGLHYPTDVLAGAAIGAALAFGSFELIG